jgi:HAE1 family hydrophobic/amphiphilic exporter-1
VRAQGRLSSPEEFEEIVVRETPQTGIVRVRDVGKSGIWDHKITASAGHLNGKPAAIVAVYQLPGSNAVEACGGSSTVDGRGGTTLSPDDMDYAVPG